MSELSHTIKRLEVHLEDQKNIYFKQDEEELALDKAENKHSTLEAYFILNQN
jgi:hypothetical protein